MHNGQQSTAKIISSLPPREDQDVVITRSFRPQRSPTFTKEELVNFAEGMKDVRTDEHNMRFDKERRVYYYLPKDHPEYKESPNHEHEKKNKSHHGITCTML